jgi:uncharacterized protein (TIGR02466 family)
MISPINYKKFELFPTPVYKSKIEVQDEWLKLCETTEYERMKTGNGDISKNRKILNDLNIKNDIEDHLNVYVRDWLKVHWKTEFYLTSSWLVKHKKGDWAQLHHHANSLISGVYYLKTPENSGNIKFHKFFNKNLFDETLRFDFTDDNFINAESVSFDVNAGDIILFPSHLTHSVDENFNDETRYSLAFNYFCRGSFGKDEYALTIK